MSYDFHRTDNLARKGLTSKKHTVKTNVYTPLRILCVPGEKESSIPCGEKNAEHSGRAG